MTHSFPTRRASDLSAEQLAKEGSPIDGAGGIVGCLYTAEPEEIPMAPITMMRNALGVEEGGSGVPLDRDAYRRSVEFWERNATWRPQGMKGVTWEVGCWALPRSEECRVGKEGGRSCRDRGAPAHLKTIYLHKRQS